MSKLVILAPVLQTPKNAFSNFGYTPNIASFFEKDAESILQSFVTGDEGVIFVTAEHMMASPSVGKRPVNDSSPQECSATSWKVIKENLEKVKTLSKKKTKWSFFLNGYCHGFTEAKYRPERRYMADVIGGGIGGEVIVIDAPTGAILPAEGLRERWNRFEPNDFYDKTTTVNSLEYSKDEAMKNLDSYFTSKPMVYSGPTGEDLDFQNLASRVVDISFFIHNGKITWHAKSGLAGHYVPGPKFVVGQLWPQGNMSDHRPPGTTNDPCYLSGPPQSRLEIDGFHFHHAICLDAVAGFWDTGNEDYDGDL